MRIDKPDSVEASGVRDQRTQPVQRRVEPRIVRPAASPQGGELDAESTERTVESGRLDRHVPVHVLEEEQIGQ